MSLAPGLKRGFGKIEFFLALPRRGTWWVYSEGPGGSKGGAFCLRCVDLMMPLESHGWSSSQEVRLAKELGKAWETFGIDVASPSSLLLGVSYS